MVKRIELELENKDFFDGFRNYGNIPELTVANGWIPWWQEKDNTEEASGEDNQGYLIRPEYRPESSRVGAGRVRTGASAQKFFTTFATHHAGLYQQVSGIPADKKITFSCWVQVWSNQKDNIEVSEEVGRYKTCVGIDPTGGTDPLSSQVVWGELVEEYDEWGKRTVSVDGAAETITVFLRSTVQWRVKHNDSYWDEARLYAEPMLKRGSDYVLLPEGAGIEMYQAVLPYIAKFGISTGQKWNDAGLLGGTVVAINPAGDVLAQLEELGASIEIIRAGGPPDLKAELDKRIRSGYHLAVKPPSSQDYILLPERVSREWYSALISYLVRFGPSSGKSLADALSHNGYVTAINPSPEWRTQLEAAPGVSLDLIEVDNPAELAEILQQRIDTGLRIS